MQHRDQPDGDAASQVRDDGRPPEAAAGRSQRLRRHLRPPPGSNPANATTPVRAALLVVINHKPRDGNGGQVVASVGDDRRQQQRRNCEPTHAVLGFGLVLRDIVRGQVGRDDIARPSRRTPTSDSLTPATQRALPSPQT